MNERKINYSDLVLRRGDSAATINEKLLTEQTEHIFSEDQALEILSEFENKGIQAGMAKQLEVLLANKEEYETAIGENKDKKEIIVEKDNPKPENIRGYDEAIAQSREEIRKINEQIAALEKGLEEMNNTQNPETDLPATEERTPEESQNPTTPVTPQDEEPRVVENNQNNYRTILKEIEKSENELRELNSRRDALKAAQENMDKEIYQREMKIIERFLAGEQLKLDQNRNLANNYEAAYSLLKDLDGLTGQPDNSRDTQNGRDEEIIAKRKELASHMDELTDTLATEVRNRVLSERANRNNNVAGLTPEQIISRYAPFAEIYDNNEIKETDPQVLVAEAERQIRERESAKEETAHKVAVRRIEPNRVINVIPSHVAGVSEEPTPEVVQTPIREEGRRLSNEEAQDAPDYVGKRLEDSQRQEPVIEPTVPETVQEPIREEGRRLSNEEAQDAPDYVGKRLEDSQSQEPVITTTPTRRNVEPDLTPDEVIRRYGPAARIYDQAGITGTRAQRLVAAARDSLENQYSNNNGLKETDPQVLVAEAERQIREREAAKEETAHKVAVRRIEPNRVINVIPSHVAGVSEEPTPKVVQAPIRGEGRGLSQEEAQDAPDYVVKKLEDSQSQEPVITTPPVSEEQKENAIVSTPAPTNLNNPADTLHNSDAQNEYNEALQDFLKIFDDERKETEEKGPFMTMEALNEFHDKYFALKEAANERLVNAKKKLEESRAKKTEQPRIINTPNLSIPDLLPANKDKSQVLALPPHEMVPELPPHIEQVPELPPHIEQVPKLPPHIEQKEDKVKKGLYTIMEELTDGLELTRKMNGKYTASNIRVVKGFKEELKSGNVLYNIVHFVPAVVAMPINFVRKVVNKLTYSMRERENVEKFKERLSKLSEEDLETIWNEYRGTKVIQERYAGIINTLINERMQQYASEKVSAIDKDIAGKYKILFDSMKRVESCDKLLQTETDLKRIAVIKQEREKALAGKAEMISSLRSQYTEANQILSGGAHGFSEDMKAAKTKLSIVGKRFAKDHDFNNELAAKQAEIEKRENAAIAKGDNEAALRAFIDGETLLRGETEIKNTIYGQRSVGEKYSMPLAQGLDYSDDPFVRDLLRSIAYIGMGVSAANALITHGPKSDALLQQNQAEVDRVNTANDTTMDQVNQAGRTLVGNKEDFVAGMQSQARESVVNSSQTLERETLDATANSSGWTLGGDYDHIDLLNHTRYNEMADTARNQLADIAAKCSAKQITDTQALELIKEVANEQHQNLVDIYTEYQPILEQYAATHPFDLHGVQESMDFVLSHPDAVVKMNEGVVESIQVGEGLAGLSAEHIAAINSLPSDLSTTLFGVATSIAALTHQTATTMSNNVKSGKYGNETTDMIQDYIDSKAKANEAAPEEKSGGRNR